MKPSVIVWDLETVPDLAGFAAANDLVGNVIQLASWEVFGLSKEIDHWSFGDLACHLTITNRISNTAMTASDTMWYA